MRAKGKSIRFIARALAIGVEQVYAVLGGHPQPRILQQLAELKPGARFRPPGLELRPDGPRGYWCRVVGPGRDGGVVVECKARGPKGRPAWEREELHGRIVVQLLPPLKMDRAS